MFLDGQKIEYRGDEVKIKVERYSNKRLRLDITDENGIPCATLTINIPEKKLQDREIIVKTWSENEGIALAALNSGIFENTGVTVPSTFVHAQIWKIKEDYILPKE